MRLGPSIAMAALIACAPITVISSVRAQPDDTRPAAHENRRIRGVVSAKMEADISVGLSARLIELPFDLGDRFEKGAKLAQFDCRQLRAEWNALRAGRRSLLQQHHSNRELFDNGAIGSLEVETGKADLERATAEAAAKQAELAECTIEAPYSGFIAARHADLFETTAPGELLLTIIDDSALEIALIAPSAWLAWLKKGEAFIFRIDETGAIYQAEVTRVGVSVDSTSQTIDLIATFTEETPNALSGMSGTAIFEQDGA